ncbi:hypothetical protein QYF61_016865 [Mycteria americana]|uniref:Uncharacterized protein n=1 Tax=Mycteria americana TaxID=33587 RepID=A0AAN7N2A4_MYCAM|nr:hypothetical protein QYF61_016865 [Mycteria americana]
MPVQAVSSQFLQENAVGDSVKGFAKVQALERNGLGITSQLWAVTPEGTEVPNLLTHGSVAGVIIIDLVFLTTGWPTQHQVCWRLMGFIFLKGGRESLLRNLRGSSTEL